MNVTIYGWIAWAAVNAVAGTGAVSEYEVAQAAGLGPLSSGAVMLAADTRALLDLNSAYGPLTAVLGPTLATGLGHLGSGHSAVPAAVSVSLAVLARTALSRNGGAS